VTIFGGSLFEVACVYYLAGWARSLPYLMAALPGICAAAAFDLFCRALRNIT
jgi:hypothetical protein